MDSDFGPLEIPGPLYKYRSLAEDSAEFVRDIIVNRQLWWSPASALNDPLDCNPLSRLTGSRVSKELSMRRTLRNCLPSIPKSERMRLASQNAREPAANFEGRMAAQIEANRAEIGVCSLSSDSTSLKLWTDYADQHRGVCLRFEDADSFSPHFALAIRVHYQKDRPSVPVYGKRLGLELLTMALLTKTQDWAYEAEWRLIDQSFTGHRKFPARAFTGVIFGKDTPQSDREAVKRWCAESASKVEFLEACDAAGGITIKPI